MASKLNISSFSTGVVTQLNEPSQLLNIDLDQRGVLRPRKSWSTFAGMVYQLWLINKRYNKMGVKGDFTVRLPLPPGNYKAK